MQRFARLACRFLKVDHGTKQAEQNYPQPHLSRIEALDCKHSNRARHSFGPIYEALGPSVYLCIRHLDGLKGVQTNNRNFVSTVPREAEKILRIQIAMFDSHGDLSFSAPLMSGEIR